MTLFPGWKTASFVFMQPLDQPLVRGDPGGLIGGVDHHARAGPGGLFHVFHRGIVHGDLPRLPALREPGGQTGGLVQTLQIGLGPAGPQYHVGAVDLLGVEPDVALKGLLAGE